MRTWSLGTLGLVATLTLSAFASAEPHSADANQRAAQAARQLSTQARSLAAYADRVATHYSAQQRSFAGEAQAAPGAVAAPPVQLSQDALPAPDPGPAAVSDERGLHNAREGVVTLERDGKALGVGTVLEGDGRILTALSNVGHGNGLDVRYADGTVSHVRVGHTDRAWDLALLIPQNGRWTRGLRASRLGLNDVGADVHSFSVQQKKLQLGRTILLDKRTLLGGDSELLHDAINIGSKLQGADVGTPVLDRNGNVVAMVARACAPGAAPTAEEPACAPVPYGVPVSAVRAFLRTVPANAVPPAPWIGVRGIAQDSGPVRGVRLLNVDPASPAAAAGLQGSSTPENADVIVAVDGAPVTTTEELSDKIQSKGVGESVQMLIYGASKFREITMTLRAAPRSH